MDQGLSLRFIAAATLAVSASIAAPAHAEGIAAGTLIENTASANFSANGVTRTIDSNTVTIAVDEVLDVAVASQDSGPLTATGAVTLRFLVTNTGNGPESYTLTADPTVAGNDFDLAVNSLAIDTNANGVYDAGVDTLIASGAATPPIDPDGSLTIFVVATVPGGAADASNSQVKLTAQATTGAGAAGTVFAGAGVGGVDAVAGFSGADDDDMGAVVASLASVSLVKSAIVVDPFGGSQPVPGATVTYTIVASIAGSGSVAGLVVSDGFPASTSYVAGSLKLGSTALSDAADADAGQATATGVAVDLGNVAAGANRTISFKVSIDS